MVEEVMDLDYSNSYLSVKSKALITTNDRVCCGAPYSCAVVRGQGGFAAADGAPLQNVVGLLIINELHIDYCF